MLDDSTKEQADKCRKLWGEVIFSVIDGAIDEAKGKWHSKNRGWIRKPIPLEYVLRDLRAWATGRDGHMVLSLAGIEPCEKAFSKLEDIVSGGIKCSTLFAEDRGR